MLISSHLQLDAYGRVTCNIPHSCHFGLVWFLGQNKRIALLSFFHGCRKRRLKEITLTPKIDTAYQLSRLHNSS
jgi:hypothetical protein